MSSPAKTPTKAASPKLSSLRRVAAEVYTQAGGALSRFQAAEVAEYLRKRYGREALEFARQPYRVNGLPVW
jgi:hypothetical protein